MRTSSGEPIVVFPLPFECRHGVTLVMQPQPRAPMNIDFPFAAIFLLLILAALTSCKSGVRCGQHT